MKDLDQLIESAVSSKKQKKGTSLDLNMLFEMVSEVISEENLNESRNTLLADINEIMMAYYLSGESWSKIVNSEEALKVLKERIDLVTQPETEDQRNRAEAMVEDQKGRAKVMAQEALKWASENGWEGNVDAVWWTARPNVLASAINSPPSPGNPTDVLVKFGDDFLGLSAKSTKSKADIGFKNPGAGSIAMALGADQDIKSIVKNSLSLVADEYPDLPRTQKQRKKYIRDLKDADLASFQNIEKAGLKLLADLRDTLVEKLKNLNDEELRDHIVDYWLDSKLPYPYYIKVTGRGKDGNYSAVVSDPTDNEKYKALMSEPLSVVPVGQVSIGIMAGDTRIMKMRYKFESQKMASSIKMSGDPW